MKTPYALTIRNNPTAPFVFENLLKEVFEVPIRVFGWWEGNFIYTFSLNKDDKEALRLINIFLSRSKGDLTMVKGDGYSSYK